MSFIYKRLKNRRSWAGKGKQDELQSNPMQVYSKANPIRFTPRKVYTIQYQTETLK